MKAQRGWYPCAPRNTTKFITRDRLSTMGDCESITMFSTEGVSNLEPLGESMIGLISDRMFSEDPTETVSRLDRT